MTDTHEQPNDLQHYMQAVSRLRAENTELSAELVLLRARLDTAEKLNAAVWLYRVAYEAYWGDLYCERCIRPMSEHQPFGGTCQNGDVGGPFRLMDSERARELHAMRRKDRVKAQQVVPAGFCLRCGHHEDAHTQPDLGCEVEVRDYGEMDCQCPGLKLCAACEGDPEAHGLHVCDHWHQWVAA